MARDPNIKLADIMLMAMSTLNAMAPLPAGFQTVSQAQDQQIKAKTRIKCAFLSKVVLASPPIVLANSAGFQDLIADPLFQLK